MWESTPSSAGLRPRALLIRLPPRGGEIHHAPHTCDDAGSCNRYSHQAQANRRPPANLTRKCERPPPRIMPTVTRVVLVPRVRAASTDVVVITVTRQPPMLFWSDSACSTEVDDGHRDVQGP
jgi:hypothetical protein